MAATPTRIYLVQTQHAGQVIARRLVRAPNQAQAIRHVATASITAEVATQDECIELAASGVRVETSGERPASDPAAPPWHRCR